MVSGDSEGIVDRLLANGTFIGGPPELFDVAGDSQLGILKHLGMSAESKVLDIGCGCLRGGRKVIPELNPGCYFGIEPNKEMLEAGIEICIDSSVISEKAPTFDYNDTFDFGVFGTKFDFFVARSIWSHASKGNISKMLDEFIEWRESGAKFVTSYQRARIPILGEYHGTSWIGRSKESSEAGIVKHSLWRIKSLCARRGLTVRELLDERFDFGSQKWLIVE
ncbi:MAG: class I SAM-dependent methyltransferase [Candidatus Thermoplasmatota archaeon]|nr:class I SAM-dependent methyltransferase [Candidatus Thermoplasmatota archaeon]